MDLEIMFMIALKCIKLDKIMKCKLMVVAQLHRVAIR